MLRLPEPGPLVIVGAGGFGRECLDIVEALNEVGAELAMVGFVDDAGGEAALLARRGTRCLGVVDAAPDHAGRCVIAIGNGPARAAIAARLTAAGVTSPVLIHPEATIGSDCRLGNGTLVNAGARATTNITLGDHVQLHANSAVGHDAVLDEAVSVFPGATVSGSVVLEREVTIGTGATVLPGIRIGARSFVGAGAVVHRDVPPDTTVVGVPARPLPASG